VRERAELNETNRPLEFDVVELEVSAKSQPLLSPVSLSLRRGEGVLISGQMGVGKSLLCESIAGFRRPGLTYTGSAGFRDGEGKPASGRTALVPQDWRLCALSTDQVRTILAEQRTRAAAYLEQLELDVERIQHLGVPALGAGERLRVLLASVLARGPDLALIDAPADVLDPRQRRLFGNVMEAALSSGMMLIVTGRDEASWTELDLRRVQLGEPVGSEAVAVPLVQKRPDAARPVAKPPALDVAELDIERRRRGFFARGRPALVVDGASMFVRHGEILVLLGPSGSGKSSLLAAMAGHLPSQAGRIRTSGVDLTSGRRSRRDPAQGRVQLVSMEVARGLDKTRTVQEHLKRALTKTDGQTPEHWLDRLGLPVSLANVAVDCLSEGEAFRLSLALSLCTDPHVVLLDTPRSGALDSDGGILTGLLLAEKARGRSFVLATSDPGISRSIADRIAILDAGRVLEFGPTALILGRPAHPRTLGLLRSESGRAHDPRCPRPACHVAGACPREVERCATERPPLDFVPGTTRNHRVACFSPSLDPIEP